MAANNNEYVLVTGATGYIGAHVLEQLLQKGFRVRFTARSPAKAESLISLHQQYKDKLDYVIVEDMGKEGSFAGLLDGLTGVFHVASPFILKVENNLRDLINPAVNGVVGLLAEATKVQTIKRIVITGSFACMVNFSLASGHVYSEADFNPITREEAIKADSVVGYVGSKRLAEKAAFDFVAENKPHFVGPLAHHINKLSELSESTKIYYELITGKAKIEFYPFDMYIDVRDLAAAHLIAFEKPEASNQRYFVSAGNYTFQEIVDYAHKYFPGKFSADKGTPGQYLPPHGKPDTSKAASHLGLKYRTKEETFNESAAQFLQFIAQGK